MKKKKSLLLTVYIPVSQINMTTCKTYTPLVTHQPQSKSLTSIHCLQFPEYCPQFFEGSSFTIWNKIR